MLAATFVGRPLLDRAVGRPDRSAEPSVASVRSPWSTVVVLLGVYPTFAAFVVLGVAGVAKPLWKPVVLPASLLPFAPVRALYAGTTVPDLVLRAVGVESPHLLRWVVLTLVVRAGFVVEGAGFAGSAVRQCRVVEGLLGRRR